MDTIYPAMPFREYRELRAMNNSTLKAGRRSMAHLRYAMDNPSRPPTTAQKAGTFHHAAQLEPLLIPQQFAVMPDFTTDLRDDFKNPRASKVYKERVAECHELPADKEIVDQATYEAALGVAPAIDANPIARKYLRGQGDSEASLVWRDAVHGIKCKARADRSCSEHPALVDIKKHDQPVTFGTAIAKYNYHQQAAWYVDGYAQITGEVVPFILIAIETEPPYTVLAAPLRDEALEQGREQYRGVLREYAACIESGCWPMPENPEEWTLPSWAQQSGDVKLTIGGQEVGV